MSNTTNISPVVSPDILKVISTSTAIKTFGAQTKDKNKETTIIGDQTKTAELSNESDILTQKEKQAGLNKNNTIQIAQYNLNTNQITQDQYNKIYEQAEVSYLVEMDAIEVQRKKLEQDKEIIENNPYTVLENNQKKSSAEVKKTKKDTQNEENKSKKDLTKQIASNTVKTLVPIIALQLSNNFSVVISQRKKLEES